MSNKSARVNVRTLVNSAKIRKEVRNGREVLVIPSATLPDNVIMNGVRYPAEAIDQGYSTLEGTPAPLGHPTLNGKFVSASDPKGLVLGFVGAWNENVRREDGRVFIDKVIDVEYAKQLSNGQRVLAAVEEGKPIHTSTGLYCTLRPLQNDSDGAKWEASGIVFDHDAILLDEPGAATPDQGVGMLVNKSTDNHGEEIELTINSALDEAERELDWAADNLFRAAERLERIPLIEKFKEMVKEMVRGKTSAEPEKLNNQEDEHGMDKAQFDELSGTIKSVAEAQAALPTLIAEAVANALKPVTESVANQQAAAAAAAKAEKDALVNKVVEAKLLTAEVANAADVGVLKALAENIKPEQKKAHRLNAAASAVTEDADFKLPKSE